MNIGAMPFLFFISIYFYKTIIEGGSACMNLYIYSDESGVFDRRHNDYFIFGGLICFGTDQKNVFERKYIHVENTLRKTKGLKIDLELKASNISNKDKGKFYRSLSDVYKFCILIKQKALMKEVFENPKHKQRYLDFAYKMVLKKCLKTLIANKIIIPSNIKNIYVYVDEHVTATDGKYELRENLLNEFKSGTFNFDYNHYFSPIFPHLDNVFLSFCDSKTTTLVRAADIIANHCYHNAIDNHGSIKDERNMFVYYLPTKRIVYTGLDYFKGKRIV